MSKRKRAFRFFLLNILFFISSVTFAKQVDLKELFSKNDTLPDVTSDNFISGNYQACFKWLTKGKNSAHFPSYSNSPAVSFFDQKVWEVNVRFNQKKFKDAEISFYNRGDAGQINESQFEKILSELDKQISVWIPVKPKVLAKKKLPKNVGYIEKKIWVNKELLVSLVWSATKVRGSRDEKPEYIKLIISKFDPKNDPRKTSASRTGSAKKNKNPKDSVKKNDDGDVFIDGIPMVDQGQKGYCAVAVTERVLRYYGQDIDQHVIAQMAASSADKGTNSSSMLEMVKKAGVKFRVKVKIYEEAKHSGDLTKDIKKYNKLLKRKKKPLVQIPPVSSSIFEQIYFQVKSDMESYKEYKCVKCKTDYNKFKKTIIKSIDSGIPILWGVQLGLVPEEKRLSQTMGGHLRLIIGYNNKSDEIVFSDTWGADHEFKKMNWGDSWCITTSYAALFPR